MFGFKCEEVTVDWRKFNNTEPRNFVRVSHDHCSMRERDEQRLQNFGQNIQISRHRNAMRGCEDVDWIHLARYRDQCQAAVTT
jgi:hypothetical protein